MSYTNSGARVDSTSSWENNFSHDKLREFYKESAQIKRMIYGVERRTKLLNLLNKGFRICLNFQLGGSWNSKDNDIKYLLKKGKIRTHKQYQRSAITDHLSHTYIGIA